MTLAAGKKGEVMSPVAHLIEKVTPGMQALLALAVLVAPIAPKPALPYCPSGGIGSSSTLVFRKNTQAPGIIRSDEKDNPVTVQTGIQQVERLSIDDIQPASDVLRPWSGEQQVNSSMLVGVVNSDGEVVPTSVDVVGVDPETGKINFAFEDVPVSGGEASIYICDVNATNLHQNGSIVYWNVSGDPQTAEFLAQAAEFAQSTGLNTVFNGIFAGTPDSHRGPETKGGELTRATLMIPKEVFDLVKNDPEKLEALKKDILYRWMLGFGTDANWPSARLAFENRLSEKQLADWTNMDNAAKGLFLRSPDGQKVSGFDTEAEQKRAWSTTRASIIAGLAQGKTLLKGWDKNDAELIEQLLAGEISLMTNSVFKFSQSK